MDSREGRERDTVKDGGEGSVSTGEKKISVGHKPLSCTQCFDALWFCYSPVHQMQQYYRLGEFDTCFHKWNALFDCLKLKTKSKSDAENILEKRESAKPHIWKFRTVEEASSNWKKMYSREDLI